MMLYSYSTVLHVKQKQGETEATNQRQMKLHLTHSKLLGQRDSYQHDIAWAVSREGD